MDANTAIARLELYNNTLCWEHEGWIYVDSMKYPHVFAAEMPRLGGKDFEILHAETREAVLFGVEASGLKFGGRTTICNVMRFRV